MKNGRVSVPGKIISLLLSDDQFYREVAGSKKISLQNFPKYDQWTDEHGFRMEFALAGFSIEDIAIEVFGNILTIRSTKDESLSEEKHEPPAPAVVDDDDDVLDENKPQVRISKGMIVRGIARRRFKTDFLISSEFNLDNLTASMKDGLLRVTVPQFKDISPRAVVISSEIL